MTTKQVNPQGAFPHGPLGREGTPVKLGYVPTYGWRNFPLNNSAPQYVFETYAALPFSVQGPGDIPVRQWQTNEKPSWALASFVFNGPGLAAGTIYYSPLTFQQPVGNPLQYMWPGTGQ